MKILKTFIFLFFLCFLITAKGLSVSAIACDYTECYDQLEGEVLCGRQNCWDCPECLNNLDIVNPLIPAELSQLDGSTFLQKFLNLGITLALVLGSIYFFFMVLLGGIGWISSSGDKAKLESAQKQLTNAFIGLVILLGSFAIIKLIEFLFGINIIKFTLPTL